MDILGIDHLELYVGDARQAAFYFSTAVGFTPYGEGGPETGLPEQRSVVLRHGSVQLQLTSALTADHPAAGYVHRHGDGIAVIALEVGDLSATYAELLHRGATVIAPPARFADGDAVVEVATVGGFGDVAHRLVQRHGPRTPFLPGAIRAAAPEPTEPELFSEIDHLAVCVPAGELGATVRRYREVFGFAKIFEERMEVAGQAMNSEVVQDPSGRVTLVVLEPDPSRRPGQLADFLRWHAGAGVQHLALRTDDIVAAVTDLGRRGVRFATTPSTYYDTLAERVGVLDAPLERLRELGILVDRDHDGQLLQIFTESMHVRRTLFLELIERRGAQTFGSGNIKALYEAKERELAAVAAAGVADPAPQTTGV